MNQGLPTSTDDINPRGDCQNRLRKLAQPFIIAGVVLLPIGAAGAVSFEMPKGVLIAQVVLVFAALLGVASLTAGLGLRAGKRWGRKLAIAAALGCVALALAFSAIMATGLVHLCTSEIRTAELTEASVEFWRDMLVLDAVAAILGLVWTLLLLHLAWRIIRVMRDLRSAETRVLFSVPPHSSARNR